MSFGFRIRGPRWSSLQPSLVQDHLSPNYFQKKKSTSCEPAQVREFCIRLGSKAPSNSKEQPFLASFLCALFSCGHHAKVFQAKEHLSISGSVAQCTNTSNKRVLRLFIFFPSSILNNYFRCSFSQSYIFGVTRIQLIAPPLIDSLCAAD